jgi:hypothetical protein
MKSLLESIEEGSQWLYDTAWKNFRIIYNIHHHPIEIFNIMLLMLNDICGSLV